MARQDFDLSQVDKAFVAMARRAKDLRPVFRKVRPMFRKDQVQHMKEQEGPKGKWPGLAQATIDKRLGRGGKAGKFTKRGKLKKRYAKSVARVLSRRLITKAKVRLFPNAIMIEASGRLNPGMTGIHQDGGVAGKGSRIPARTFMWVSEEFARAAAAEMAKILIEAWKGR